MIGIMSEEFVLTDEQCRAIQDFMKRKRLEAGYERQSDAAAAIGVSQDLISRLESRFTPNIRLGEFGRILQKYGVAPNEAYTLIGLYTPIVPDESKRSWVMQHIMPFLAHLNQKQLDVVRRVVEGLSGGAAEDKQ